MFYLVYFSLDPEDYNKISKTIVDLKNKKYHFHRLSKETPKYFSSLIIPDSISKNFWSEFFYACIILSELAETDRVVFLGAGDHVVCDEMNLNSKIIYRNKIEENSVVNKVFNLFFVNFSVKNKIGFSMTDEFKNIGYYVGFLGAYTYSIAQIKIYVTKYQAPNSLWFIAEFLNEILKSRKYFIEPSNIKVTKAIGLDKTIGSANYSDELKRLELCELLPKIIETKLFLIPRIQYIKFFIRIKLKGIFK
jgi:hypothetical protein